MKNQDKKEIKEYSKKTSLYLSRRRFDDEGVLIQIICSRCKSFKNVNEFSKDKREIDGIDHKCKACR